MALGSVLETSRGFSVCVGFLIMMDFGQGISFPSWQNQLKDVFTFSQTQGKDGFKVRARSRLPLAQGQPFSFSSCCKNEEQYLHKFKFLRCPLNTSALEQKTVCILWTEEKIIANVLFAVELLGSVLMLGSEAGIVGGLLLEHSGVRGVGAAAMTTLLSQTGFLLALHHPDPFASSLFPVLAVCFATNGKTADCGLSSCETWGVNPLQMRGSSESGFGLRVRCTDPAQICGRSRAV